jgi:hypothetical protein
MFQNESPHQQLLGRINFMHILWIPLDQSSIARSDMNTILKYFIKALIRCTVNDHSIRYVSLIRFGNFHLHDDLYDHLNNVQNDIALNQFLVEPIVDENQNPFSHCHKDLIVHT